jgi:hypothetical protein
MTDKHHFLIWIIAAGGDGFLCSERAGNTHPVLVQTIAASRERSIRDFRRYHDALGFPEVACQLTRGVL